MVERMAINQSQAAMLTADGLKAVEPAVTGLQMMPMMFRDFEEVDYVSEQLRAMLEQRMLVRGFVVLGWADAGWVRFFSRQPVVYPDDLKHQKLFTTAGSPETEEVYSSAGFNSVPLETTDILTGLQTGLIDAVPTIPFFALATRLYGPAPYMLDLNWAPLVGALVVTRAAWEAIPEAYRPAMLEAAQETATEIKVAGRREGDEAVETMRTRWNLQVTPVEPGGAVEAAWRRAAEAAYPRIRGRIVPAEIFDEVQRLLREYRQAKGNRE
jgi:TRAP-type C4-dicarboxylate transport system substrate-binding protein